MQLRSRKSSGSKGFPDERLHAADTVVIITGTFSKRGEKNPFRNDDAETSRTPTHEPASVVAKRV
jgi:hypothetical protein